MANEITNLYKSQVPVFKTGLAVNENGKLIFDSQDELCQHCIEQGISQKGCECDVKTIATPRTDHSAGFKATVRAIFYSALAWVVFLLILKAAL